VPRLAQFSVGFIRDLFYFAAARGADPATLCTTAGLPVALLQSPESTIDGELAERCWQAALAATRDPDLGLHLGEAAHPSALGVLGFAMLSSETLGVALGRLVRYWRLKGDATRVELAADMETVTLTLHLLDLPGNFLLRFRHPAESSLAAAVSLLQALVGRRIPIHAVRSCYAPPPQDREYVRIFGRRPEFDAAANQIAIPAESLQWPVLLANAEVVAGLDAQMERRLSLHVGALTDRVREEMARALRGEVPTVESVARALHKSGRQLQRELQLAGVSFRELLDQLRHELAVGHLRDGRLSIADISFLLGFSEPSAFHRSFRKWTGQTPQAYRNAL
jgi:AraC-like DNA-binding protein